MAQGLISLQENGILSFFNDYYWLNNENIHCETRGKLHIVPRETLHNRLHPQRLTMIDDAPIVMKAISLLRQLSKLGLNI